MGNQAPSKHYGTQVKGAFIMFVAVTLVAMVRFWDVDTREAELWRRALWYLLAGGWSLLTFVVFFVGLKVFAGGLLGDFADSVAAELGKSGSSESQPRSSGPTPASGPGESPA